MTLPNDSRAVREALRRAGWTEGRQVDVSHWVEELEAVGYRPHPLARRIWSEYGGLTVRSAPEREPGSSLYIDPVDACIDSFEESVTIGDRYGEDFSPLGMWSSQFRSYVSASGTVVAVTVRTVWDLGASFAEALAYTVEGDGRGSRARRADWLG
ncbi:MULTISPECIES: SUKH-3 domain-containing protein [Streptomyces]|uniref:SUKH-3 domain-containing protein n=1 Tax=Streptomyces TaxID=1883 RepID=UPI00158710CD|nr:SUKH-3 domain-containing protein [Streptomyces sp. CAI-85]MBO7935687.1 SUKH-3 domain-containing protein [Streptomyces sp. S9]NUV62222.1 hypothetical protein [Streptomyces sp. CAI-85]